MENRVNKLSEDEMGETEKKEDKQLTVTRELEIIDGLKEKSDLSSDENSQSTGMEALTTIACNFALHDSEDNEEEFYGDNDNESDSDLNSKSDDDSWITPENISSVKGEMGRDGLSVAPASDVIVACLTTDFAVQVISFCSHLVTGKCNKLIEQVIQAVQNFTCHSVSGRRKYKHLSPILRYSS